MSEELKFTTDGKDRTPPWTFIKPPPAVGWWILPGSIPSCQIKFSVPSKPNRLHRKMMQWLMGWKWEENK